MKSRYSIGEVSKMLNISVSNLRFYDKIDLVKPAYTDKFTGYRYYIAEQFHYLDRIKYLQKLNFSLEEIREIVFSEDASIILPKLSTKIIEIENQISSLKNQIKIISWYKEYFSYESDMFKKTNIYTKEDNEKYFLCTYCDSTEPLLSSSIRLTALKSRPEYRDLEYLRQWVYILDTDDLLKGKFTPIRVGIMLKEKPNMDNVLKDDIFVAPNANYICFQSQILKNNFNRDVDKFKDRISNEKFKPILSLAYEYEDNFHDYSTAPYEIQLLYNSNEVQKIN